MTPTRVSPWALGGFCASLLFSACGSDPAPTDPTPSDTAVTSTAPSTTVSRPPATITAPAPTSPAPPRDPAEADYPTVTPRPSVEYPSVDG